jgi:hypothetical protein
MKWGPTWANAVPLRIVYVTTPEGKGRLLPHLQPGNAGKASAAPVNAILAVDNAFRHHVPRLLPFRPEMRDALPGRQALPPGPWAGSTLPASTPSSSPTATGARSSSSTSATLATAPGARPGYRAATAS